jgi:NADH-quinone oxidoreductase subunit E
MADTQLSAEDRIKLEDARQAMMEIAPQRSSLIPMLQMVQHKLAYLPAPAIEMVARYLKLSPSEVYGVATFYNQFRFRPPGRNPVCVCMGTACHVKGSDIILENFERKLEIKEGQITPDREFSIDRVACVGCCALAPVALIGATLHGHMMPSKVEGLILRVRIEKEKAERAQDRNETQK